MPRPQQPRTAGLGLSSLVACAARFPCGWELSMSQPLAYRVAVRAAQFAIAAAGIIFLLLLFSRQAHAATGDGHPGTGSAAGSVTALAAGSHGAATPASGDPLGGAAAALTSTAGSV